MLDLSGQRALVLGLGLSGRSAAAFCAARGALVVAADERPARELEALDALEGIAELVLGSAFPDPADFDLVVPSPGIPPARYRERARRVWGDVELAYRALSIPIVAVTGTNGKSTTTALVALMLRAAGLRAAAAGNIGTPALDLVGAALDVGVLEISSFQLETIDAFRPAVAVILNLTPDHVDRHGSFEAYVAAKARALAGQRAEDTAILNFDDPAVRALADTAPARVVPFRTRGPLQHGAWLDAGCVALRLGDAPVQRLSLDGLRLTGAHNRENALAALCAAACAGADPEKALYALTTFEGLPHRTQVVARRGDVLFIDDSKATNPGAALSSLASFDAPLVWIAGGRAKGIDLTPLAEAAGRRVRAAVLLGEAAGQLERALAGRVPTCVVGSIEDAVRRAAEFARPGDLVLLAPGCSSLDQFRNYEERGRRFRAAAESLPGAEGTR
ncbi:MAG TPA: UDP-N-acetylmuramoyl-L-alanine--D-glutamate ligase [Myxococcota bacterium]